MLKLVRYLKRYIAYLLVAVVLLACQAFLELSLPDSMSNIVNNGIQKGGITETAPKALPQDMMLFLSRFTSEEDAEILNESYTSFEDLEYADKEKALKTFPKAEEDKAYILTATAGQLLKAEDAFTRTHFAFLQFMVAMSSAGNEEAGKAPNEIFAAIEEKAPPLAAALKAQSEQNSIAETGSSEVSFDFEKMLENSAMFDSIPQFVYDMCIEQSRENAEPILASSVATSMNKSIYKMLDANTDKMQSDYIFKTGAYMVLLTLAIAACAIATGYCFAKIGAGIARDLRVGIYSKVSSFTSAEMDQFSTSSLITRTTNDITNVQMLYTMGMRMVVFAPIMGIGGVVMAYRKSPSMTWIIGLSVAIMMMVILIVMIIVMPKFKKMQSLVDRLTQVSRESLSGIMVVRAFSNQKFHEGRFEEANQNLKKNSLFTMRSMATLMPIIMLLFNGTALFITWIGAKQIEASTIQIGDIMAFIQYAMQVIMSFMFVAMIFVIMPRATVSAGRINEVLRSKSIIDDPKDPKTFGEKAKGLVQFKNVSFKYNGAEEYVLHDISFTAKPGETTAFIGSTGSGKSTVVNLLPRFYDVSEGAITIDDIDVRDVTQHELRENIGFVPQKGLLFSGTVESNLKFGDANVSDEILALATEISQAKEFVETSEKGYATEISQGGTNVSGGQRQRLAIARALVKQAAVYVFDDSFSALDFATDARLRAALKPYTKESAMLVVAQRVASIMYSEQIIVLNEGRIVGKGTHKELMKNCEAYREIAESQLSKEELA